MRTKIIVVSIFAAAGIAFLWNQPFPQSANLNQQGAAFTLFSRKSDELAKKASEFEREMKVLKNDGRKVGMEHIQRLWQRLLELWQKGALTRAKAIELYKTLVDIYWMSNPPSTTARQTDAHPNAIAEADKKHKAELEEQKKRRENPYYDCPADTPPPVLTADFTDASLIKMITPPGTLTGDRDVAKGHFWIWTDGTRAPLYAPVDAIFESISSGPASAKNPTIHYTLNFKVKEACGFKFRFGHVTEPDTSLQPGTELSAGTQVGYTIGNIPSGNWDIGFYNMLKDGELAKINAYGLHRNGVCLIDYYPSERQNFYRALFDPDGPHRVCQY